MAETLSSLITAVGRQLCAEHVHYPSPHVSRVDRTKLIEEPALDLVGAGNS